MKLLHYTLRNLFIPLLVLFVGWACVFYGMVLHEVNDETNDTLENYKDIIIRSVLADTTLLKDHVDIMTRYYIREVPEEEARLDEDEFYDSTAYIAVEMEDEPVRVLRTYFRTANRKYYELTIETSTLEKEDMIETIVWSMAALYLLLIGCILVVFRYAFHKSFRPLYRLLNWLKQFRLGEKKPPLDDRTRIEEFAILTETVKESVKRSDELYNKQKQFVENAAHELQTPLAICRNKLELLSENPACTEEQLKQIGDVHHTLNHIIRLNKSLLLLTRIENKQFPDTREIYLDRLIRDLLEEFSEMYEHKAIRLSYENTAPLVCTMNESLCVTLLSNLIKNAFVHNYEEGKISVATSRRTLTIANTSPSPALNPAVLFGRFARQTDRTGSTGLGLAIVKSIADLYDIQITYTYRQDMHQFHFIFH